jgi:hypothetical protein
MSALVAFCGWSGCCRGGGRLGAVAGRAAGCTSTCSLGSLCRFGLHMWRQSVHGDVAVMPGTERGL